MTKEKSCSYVRIAVAALLFAGAAIITYLLKTQYDMSASGFDLSVQEFFFSLRSDALNCIIIPLTHCGDPISIVVLCAILLALPNRLKYGVPVSLSALCGLAIYKPLKHLFLRARPDVSLHLVSQGGYSFPSGHATTSVIVFGLLLYLLRKHCKNEILKNALSAVFIIFMIFIGLSRIYVGVHWPTDVLCGWFIGGGVLLTAINILERTYKKNESL